MYLHALSSGWQCNVFLMLAAVKTNCQHDCWVKMETWFIIHEGKRWRKLPDSCSKNFLSHSGTLDICYRFFSHVNVSFSSICTYNYKLKQFKNFLEPSNVTVTVWPYEILYMLKWLKILAWNVLLCVEKKKKI